MPDPVLNTEITKVTETQFSLLKKINPVGSLDQQMNVQDDKWKHREQLSN